MRRCPALSTRGPCIDKASSPDALAWSGGAHPHGQTKEDAWDEEGRAAAAERRNLSRDLVDVEDPVRGGVHESDCGGGGRERPKRAPGHHLRWPEEGRGCRGLVPPGRGRATDARGMARADGAHPRPVAHKAGHPGGRDSDGTHLAPRTRRGLRRAVPLSSSVRPKKEWIRRSRSGSRGPFYLAKTSLEMASLGGDPSAGSPTDTLFTWSPCRHGAWTVSSSDDATSEPGVQSLRVPILRSAFPADCPHLEIVTFRGTRGSSEFPAYSQVCSRSSRIGSRNTFT